MTFYYSRLADEPTGTIVSLESLWFLSNVANSVETKVLHKTSPIALTTIGYVKLLFKTHVLLSITLMFKTYNKIVD